VGLRKLPGEIHLSGRAMFDTMGANHPAGTLVTPVTVGRVPHPSHSESGHHPEPD
jgi:hypothetical protein